MGNIKVAIDYIKERKLNEAQALEVLKQSTTLDQNEKNLVYVYCFPRPLPDYGLPDRVQDFRIKAGIGENGDDREIALLLEACQTEQYGRFMKHIMHAFENPENVHPIEGTGTDTFHQTLAGIISVLEVLIVVQLSV